MGKREGRGLEQESGVGKLGGLSSKGSRAGGAFFFSTSVVSVIGLSLPVTACGPPAYLHHPGLQSFQTISHYLASLLDHIPFLSVLRVDA